MNTSSGATFSYVVSVCDEVSGPGVAAGRGSEPRNNGITRSWTGSFHFDESRAGHTNEREFLPRMRTDEHGFETANGANYLESRNRLMSGKAMAERVARDRFCLMSFIS